MASSCDDPQGGLGAPSYASGVAAWTSSGTVFGMAQHLNAGTTGDTPQTERTPQQLSGSYLGTFAGVADSEFALRSFLATLPGVDAVGNDARSATLMSRSFKQQSKVAAVDLAISMVDLTTLEGTDTPARVQELVQRAISPDPLDASTPSTAAVCVFGDLAGHARTARGSAGVRIAAVAGGFPHGRMSIAAKLLDVGDALGNGAEEIDMVIDRGAMLAGRYGLVHEEIVAIRQRCQDAGARLKVILETGELGSYDVIRRAAWISMLAGADFVKTSTGKIPVAATPGSTYVLLEAVRDFHEATGVMVGVKPAGGIKTTKQALGYLALVQETAGPEWLDPKWFRFGASGLLTDLVMQRQRIRTGAYSSPNHVPGASSGY